MIEFLGSRAVSAGAETIEFWVKTIVNLAMFFLSNSYTLNSFLNARHFS